MLGGTSVPIFRVDAGASTERDPYACTAGVLQFYSVLRLPGHVSFLPLLHSVRHLTIDAIHCHPSILTVDQFWTPGTPKSADIQALTSRPADLLPEMPSHL